MKKHKKLGRPPLKIKKSVSKTCRLHPGDWDKIRKKFGHFQVWIDLLLKGDV